MFNPLDNTELETFFNRLNAPLRRMPPQERAELHLEVRQHLDGLTAAYEELGLSRDEALESAIRSFGDPRKIGRRMFWEWRRGQWRGVSPEMKAVVTMLGLYGASTSLLIAGLQWGFSLAPVHGAFPLWAAWALSGTLLAGVPTLAGSVLGRLFPKQAVVGAFYATIALTLMPLFFALACLPFAREAFVTISLWAGCWLPCACGAASLSSRGRAGRFRLTELRLRRR